MSNQDLSGRNAARARREAQIYGKAALPAKASSTATAPATPRKDTVAVTRTSATSTKSGRDASRARRKAMSSHGKTGIASNDRQRTVQTTRGASKQDTSGDCGCGCTGSGDCRDTNTIPPISALLATANKAAPALRRNEAKVVTPSSAGRINARMRRKAMSALGKTGADASRKGLSSAQMVRQQNPDISGRELARSVRAQRSSNGGQSTGRSAPAGRRRPERPRLGLTGTVVSHSEKTTGDETGLCRTVTGTEYFSSQVFASFCQTETPKVPRKVDTSDTLRGGRITSGGMVGRSDKVTGDEHGSCLGVTGTEYVGREQYDDFCKAKPEPGSAKVSFSQTTRGLIVSGSKPARSKHVTGDEAGTCNAVTGTPYAGAEQYRKYCTPDDAQQAETRNQRRNSAGRDITGLQPGLAGLTGAEKGACRPVSGTAYIGATQLQETCGAKPAQIGEADFPQPLSGAPWGAFSVVPPGHASQAPTSSGNVTGTRYEQGRISGTFSLGEGKITGTEQFRFGEGKARTAAPNVVTAVDAPKAKASRVTGEGIDIGMKITGDDWNRGNRVTGTEGASAVKRNPTRRGPVSAMPTSAQKRNEEVDRGDIQVTGGSGGTDKGAPITVSGGARG